MSEQATPQGDSEEDDRHEGVSEESDQNREERPVDPAPEDEAPD